MVRADAQPDLCRHGRALRHDDFADAQPQTVRQGEARIVSLDALDRLRAYNQSPKIIMGVKFNDEIEVVKSLTRTAAA